MILKKNKFFESTILKKKLFLKSTILIKICTQKITFWFNLPRKMRKFCILRTFLKSMILMKKIVSKEHAFEEKTFSKKHDFE